MVYMGKNLGLESKLWTLIIFFRNDIDPCETTVCVGMYDILAAVAIALSDGLCKSFLVHQ